MNKNKTDQLLETIVGRLDSIEEKMVTKDYLKNVLSGYPTKKDFKKLDDRMKRMENRLIKKLNFVVDHFDSENMEIKERLNKVEKGVDMFASA